MNDHDAPDRRTLTLLVQLFGRDVMDRLARAGFEDDTAIVSAGADRLAAEGGVSLAVAQRVVAVVEETRGPSPAPPAAQDGAKAGAPGESRRRKAPARRPASGTPAKRTGTAPVPAALGDPFVDDVALVTWMGFSSKTPSGRLSFSVADGILDPMRQGPFTQDQEHLSAEEEASTSTEMTPPASAAGTVSRTQAEQEPAGQADPGPSSPRTLPGSFWSFGRPAEPRSAPDDPPARPSGRTADPQAPADAPPRRKRHDH